MTAPAEQQGTQARLLPEGACLLHIGPYKTGSTALQSALFAARPDLARYGVAYPGKWRRAMRPGWAVLGYTPRGRTPTPISVWDDFCAEVRALADQRVCVSTEDFGSAGLPRIERIVAGLGRDRLHVVAVARRLDRLLPSQWQERVKSHDTMTFDAWLHRVLGDDGQDREHRRFWASHDLVAMAERWLPHVGADGFTFVVADEADPDVVPRAFERMLGLPTGLLVLPEGANASLSANATELVRRVNELFERRGWPDETYYRMVQQGLVREVGDLPRSPSEEPIPALPAWAAARVAQLSDARVEQLRGLGVQVVGDLDRLRGPAALTAQLSAEPPARPEVVSLDTAVRAVAGLVEATVAERGNRRAAGANRRAAGAKRRRARADAPSPEDLGGRELLRAVARRVLQGGGQVDER